MKWIAAAILLAGIVPAAAQAPAYTAEDFLTVAGLTPQSSVADAERLYGKDWRRMGADGIEYMAAGSLADAWMTFRPGAAVYVDCGVAPANLPDDVASRLCQIALGTDWRQSLVQLAQLLRLGRPNGAVQSAFQAEGPLSGPQALDRGNRDRNDDQDGDANVFVEVSRIFGTQRYTVTVEAAPRITTKDGTSRAAVLVTWKPN